MRDDFEYLQTEVTKRGLATIANQPLYRLRRLELICYISLIANILFAVAYVAMIFWGR